MKRQVKQNKGLSSDPVPQTAQDRNKILIQALSRHKHRLTVLIIVAAVIGYWIYTATSTHSSWAIFGQYPLAKFVTNVLVTYLAILFCYVLLGRQLWRQRAINALLQFVTVSMILLLIELPAVLGLVDYRVLLVPKMIGGVGPHNRQLEPTFYFHRPAYDQFVNALPGDHVVTLGVNSDRRYAAEHRYDQNGFRNDQDLERASVVLIGDSFVEGYKVTQEKIISTQLHQFLGVDVSNLGQADFGPNAELAVLRILGIGLRPSVVVWFFFEGNDLRDYQETKRKWKSYVDDYYSYKKRSLFRNLLISAAIHTKRILHPRRNNALQWSGRLMSQVEDQGDTMYFRMKPYPVREEYLAHLEKFQMLIVEAKSTCDQNRIQFLLVYVPLKFRVYRDFLVFPKGSKVVHWALNDFPDRLARWSEASGISFLNLTPALKRAANEGVLVYYFDDEHWTSEGHEIVAQQIAGFMREKGWLNVTATEPD